jgi:hypothetical protein
MPYYISTKINRAEVETEIIHQNIRVIVDGNRVFHCGITTEYPKKARATLAHGTFTTELKLLIAQDLANKGFEVVTFEKHNDGDSHEFNIKDLVKS